MVFADDILEGGGLVLSARSGMGGCDVLMLGAALDWLNAGDLVCDAVSEAPAVVETLDRAIGVWLALAGWAGIVVGEELTLDWRATCDGKIACVMDELGAGSASGGGGSGAIPMLLFSLAAAAAAAEAYFKISPGGLVGTAAGFMWLVIPFVLFDVGVCKVASEGRGLFI